MERKITGIMVYYLVVCRRKLWYFVHQIHMEQGSEAVKLGKILDESSYSRDEKHVNIDDTINIDFIRARGIIHEVKKSKQIEEASIWQVKYYLYYLKTRGVEPIKGKIDYPLLKQSLEIELEQEDEIKMEEMILEIETIMDQSSPPQLIKMKICKSCAYFDLCYI